MPQFTFTYKDIRHGWATASVAAEGSNPYVMKVSCLSDALHDLASAVNALLRLDYSGEVRCSWEDEPGEYRWIMKRVGNVAEDIESSGGNAVISVGILDFRDNWDHEEDAAGREAFATECSAMRLATQVKGQMQQLLNEYGLDGYKERWMHHAFPTDEFQKLSEWINNAKHGHK